MTNIHIYTKAKLSIIYTIKIEGVTFWRGGDNLEKSAVEVLLPAK
jgi:hypothetical protein